MIARKQIHLLRKSMRFIKRQHVLLRLMFLFVWAFFICLLLLFPEFDFLHCDSLWAVSFLSATFTCHNVGCYFRNQRNWNFFWLGLPRANCYSLGFIQSCNGVVLLYFRVICTLCLHRSLVGASCFTGMHRWQNCSISNNTAILLLFKIQKFAIIIDFYAKNFSKIVPFNI